MKHSWIGDANLDGEFNSADFVQVFIAGKYEMDVNANWADGDWNGDGRFSSGDFVASFTDGGYEHGRRTAVSAVPEPSSNSWLVFAFAAIAAICRHPLARRYPLGRHRTILNLPLMSCAND